MTSGKKIHAYSYLILDSYVTQFFFLNFSRECLNVFSSEWINEKVHICYGANKTGHNLGHLAGLHNGDFGGPLIHKHLGYSNVASKRQFHSFSWPKLEDRISFNPKVLSQT